MTHQEFPDWYVIVHNNDHDSNEQEPVTGEGKCKRKKKKRKKKPHERAVDRLNMLEKGNARYPVGMFSNQVLPRWHASGIDFLRNTGLI